MRLTNFKANIVQYSAMVLLALLILINIFITPNFFNMNTLYNSITQVTPIILTGMGMTLVISTGGIDISVGSIMAVSAIFAASMMMDVGIVVSLILALVLAGVIGSFTGLMISRLNLQPMVITLGLNLALRGVAQVMSNGRDVYFNTLDTVGEQMSNLGVYQIGGVVPIQVVPVLISIILVWILAEKMMLGRQIQAVGDNAKSSQLVGINSVKILMFVYALSGVFAGLAGFMQAARVSVASGSSLGQGAALDAIAAVVICAFILQVLNLTFVMNNIHEAYAQVFKALIIVLAVYIQRKED